MVFSAIGLSRLTARVEVEKLFDPDSAIISSLTRLEERMGPIDQAEFLIEFADVGAKDFHLRSKLIYKIQRYLSSSLDEIGTINSLHNYLPREPREPTGKGFRARLRKGAYQQRLDAQRDELAQTRFLNVCLLYTSPSPRDGLLSRMPSSA